MPKIQNAKRVAIFLVLQLVSLLRIVFTLK
jgi:hypothetical protein